MAELKALQESVPLSQAIPDEYLDLKEGLQFAITGVIIVERMRGEKSFNQARIHGLSLPDGKDFVKYRTSAGAVVRKCQEILVRFCHDDGSCRKAIRVKVIQNPGSKGPWLDLVDA